MIVPLMGDITAAQAMAFCMSQPGFTQADCNEHVNTHLVNGQYCDGDVVSTKPDPNGPIIRTCIPQATIEKKIAAMQANPQANLAQARKVAAPIPWSLVLAAGAAAVAIYWARLR